MKWNWDFFSHPLNLIDFHRLSALAPGYVRNSRLISSSFLFLTSSSSPTSPSLLTSPSPLDLYLTLATTPSYTFNSPTYFINSSLPRFPTPPLPSPPFCSWRRPWRGGAASTVRSSGLSSSCRTQMVIMELHINWLCWKLTVAVKGSRQPVPVCPCARWCIGSSWWTRCLHSALLLLRSAQKWYGGSLISVSLYFQSVRSCLLTLVGSKLGFFLTVD